MKRRLLGPFTIALLLLAPLVWAGDGRAAATSFFGKLLVVFGLDAGWQIDPNGGDNADAGPAVDPNGGLTVNSGITIDPDGVTTSGDDGRGIDPNGLRAGSAMDPNGLGRSSLGPDKGMGLDPNG